MGEKEVGTVENYFSKISVAVVRISGGEVAVGSNIAIRGTTTDVTQVVESIQVEHSSVESAGTGDLVGLKVSEKVRPNDKVYIVTDD
jgi:putative protease